MALLYHYCSTETFVSIILNRTIRLSSLSLSNDSKEGSVILDVLLQVARESDLGHHKISILENELKWVYDQFDGLGFCLSEEPDLLSQWRGYADDGRGVCIGFSSDYLLSVAAKRRERNEKPFFLTQIVYDLDGQRKIATERFEEIKDLLNQGAFQPLNKLAGRGHDDHNRVTNAGVASLLSTMGRMFDIKNPAFIEEKEWRLVSLSPKSIDDEEWELSYRSVGDKVVPYFEVDLEELGAEPIGRVFLGPKHQTPRHVLERLLASHGFRGVEIHTSAATYR